MITCKYRYCDKKFEPHRKNVVYCCPEHREDEKRLNFKERMERMKEEEKNNPAAKRVKKVSIKTRKELDKDYKDCYIANKYLLMPL